MLSLVLFRSRPLRPGAALTLLPSFSQPQLLQVSSLPPPGPSPQAFPDVLKDETGIQASPALRGAPSPLPRVTPRAGSPPDIDFPITHPKAK